MTPRVRLARVTFTLTDDELGVKRTALARYTSQQEQMGVLLAALTRRTEPFTVFSSKPLHHIGRMIESRGPVAPTPGRR